MQIQIPSPDEHRSCHSSFKRMPDRSESSSPTKPRSAQLLRSRRSSQSSATRASVPSNDVGRLSYYLKCCLFCRPGDFKNVPLQVFDYHNAHRLPRALQDIIFRLAFHRFSLQDLMSQQTIRLDDGRSSLGTKASNKFVDCASQQQGSSSRKAMICTSAWLAEYFIQPFYRYHYGTTSIPDEIINDAAIHSPNLPIVANAKVVLAKVPQPESISSSSPTKSKRVTEV